MPTKPTLDTQKQSANLHSLMLMLLLKVVMSIPASIHSFVCHNNVLPVYSQTQSIQTADPPSSSSGDQTQLVECFFTGCVPSPDVPFLWTNCVNEASRGI